MIAALPHLARARLGCAAALMLALSAGCGALRSTTTPPPAFYSLDNARLEAGSERIGARAATTLPHAAPTLIVNPPHAASGFDSSRIIYTRKAHQLEYFAHSEWVDTPARMLAPLIAAAIENSGAFRAVAPTPSAAVGELRLDSEIVRLQHDFSPTPSRARFTLRAYIVAHPTRKLLAWREFDETVAAASDDPYAGVIAANRAVQIVLERLAQFCAETAAQPPPR